MADRLVTALTAITGANTATGDLFVIDDISDATDDATGTVKKITRAETANAILLEKPDLAAIEALTSAADKGIQFTGSGTAGTFDLFSGAWTAFTPTLSDGWALGNSTYTAVYARIGRMIHFYALVTIGSSATIGTTLGVALPVTAASANGAAAGCQGVFGDVGASTYKAHVVGNTTTVVRMRIINCSGTYATVDTVTSTVPFTWVTGDLIFIWGTYEAAS